jgi:hypothetical protein
VEGVGDALQPEGRVGQLDGPLHAPEGVGRPREQAVVRADEHAVPGLEHDGAPLGADAGVDHGQVDGRRQELDRLGEHVGALAYVLGLDGVGDVDDAHSRGGAGDHAMAHTDEVVVQTVVTEEGDPVESRHASSSSVSWGRAGRGGGTARPGYIGPGIADAARIATRP